MSAESSGSVPLQLDLAANAPVNLAALQRIDADVLAITATAAYTCIYQYAAESDEWVRPEGGGGGGAAGWPRGARR